MNCNQYTKSALVARATAAGIGKTEASRMKKEDLCIRLGLTVGDGNKFKPTQAPAIDVSRPCNEDRPSKKNPNAYTKQELVKLAVSNLNITTSAAGKLSKTELCEQLKLTVCASPRGRSPSYTPSDKTPTSEIITSEEPSEALSSPGGTPSAKKSKSKSKSKGKGKGAKREKGLGKKKASLVPETAKPAPKIKRVKSDIKLTPIRSPIAITKVTQQLKKSALNNECVKNSNLPLRPHQIRVVDHMRRYRGLIAAHEVGAGKTLTAVTASQCFLQDNPNGKVIVVTPVSLQENFLKEMRAYGADPDDPHYEFHTLQGFANTYGNEACPDNALLIIDEAHELRTEVSTAKRMAKRRAEGGKVGSVRADVAIRCAKNVSKVLLLTGTAVYNSPHDIVNLAAMVRAEDPLSKKRFERLQADKKEFNDYFSCLISFYQADKADGYPSFTEHKPILIPMSEDYYERYKDVENRNSNLFDSDPWSFLTGVRQAANALGDCLKCPWVINKIKEGEKTVIYSAFINYGIDLIKNKLRPNKRKGFAGVPFVEITGNMSKKARQKAVDDYNSGKVKVFFITKAGGQGLDLKETRNIIILESPWSRETENQVIGRAIRYLSHAGLTKNQQHVDIYRLLSVKPEKTKIPSADQYLQMILAKKYEKNTAFLEKLAPLSIEQRKC